MSSRPLGTPSMSEKTSGQGVGPGGARTATAGPADDEEELDAAPEEPTAVGLGAVADKVPAAALIVA